MRQSKDWKRPSKSMHSKFFSCIAKREGDKGETEDRAPTLSPRWTKNTDPWPMAPPTDLVHGLPYGPVHRPPLRTTPKNSRRDNKIWLTIWMDWSLVSKNSTSNDYCLFCCTVEQFVTFVFLHVYICNFFGQQQNC